jgi:prolyl oligopeptidase
MQHQQRHRSVLLALGVLLGLAPALRAGEAPKPPETRRDSVVDVVHGVEIPDPYRWLEDQKAPETRAWIDAQNAYTRKVLEGLPGKEEISRRLTELLRIDTIGVPFVRGGRYYYSKRRADQDLAVLYMRKDADAPEEVLLDPHPLSADHSVSVGFLDVTPDGRTLAYAIRTGGEDEVVVRFLDVDSREHLADVLPRGRYSGVTITPDRSAVYYSRQTKDGPRVFRHALGRDPETDREMFGRGYGPEKLIGVGLSDDGRYLSISVFHGSAARKSELYVQDLKRGTPLVTIVNDVEAQFTGQFAGERLFLRTDWNAPNYRLLAVDLDDPARDRWKEIVPEGKGVLAGVAAAGGKLFVRYLENVQSRLVVLDPDGRLVREVSLPSIGSVGGVSGDWESDLAFFAFSSLVQPTTIYRYDIGSGRQQVWARLEVPVRTEDVELKQVWYTSKDGTKVPMFLAHRKGIRLDRTNPTLLTGYGGFSASLTPSFSQPAAFWVENGGVFALPNLRGGGEFGERWHQAGMLDRKQNVFDDFVAAAEWLIAKKYTSPSKLVISGGSNGGLLVGAAMTQRPELFQAVVCSYPLLDMVRYHRFLVARYWVPEYGSAEDPQQFKVLHAYSPYHRVRAGTKYPAVLFITGDADTRVDPLHARKMAALVQASTGSDRPVLLHYDTKAGHSGGRPVSKVVEDLADEMRFLFGQLGWPAPGADRP